MILIEITFQNHHNAKLATNVLLRKTVGAPTHISRMCAYNAIYCETPCKSKWPSGAPHLYCHTVRCLTNISSDTKGLYRSHIHIYIHVAEDEHWTCYRRMHRIPIKSSSALMRNANQCRTPSTFSRRPKTSWYSRPFRLISDGYVGGWASVSSEYTLPTITITFMFFVVGSFNVIERLYFTCQFEYWT